ncbi:hypothetical protein EMIT0P100_90174 [Pseudomonas sp. IT-P100]|jgi:hypothetical protein
MGHRASGGRQAQGDLGDGICRNVLLASTTGKEADSSGFQRGPWRSPSGLIETVDHPSRKVVDCIEHKYVFWLMCLLVKRASIKLAYLFLLSLEYGKKTKKKATPRDGFKSVITSDDLAVTSPDDLFRCQ